MNSVSLRVVLSVVTLCWSACAEDGAEQGMVAVEAGRFWMGCNESVDSDCFPYELPYHEVQLDAYAIGVTEVTQEQYAACVTAGACREPSCDWEPVQKAAHPVVCVDWQMASDYCAWVGKRLCSEAEWEKAARGTAGLRFPWGNGEASCELAVMREAETVCQEEGTRPVGSRPDGQSPFGLQDMAGNVLEWVADWFAQDYYAHSPAANPRGPDSGQARVMRGGSFRASALTIRASYRAQADPAQGYYDLGLRCCR
jgi:formylglycine-generating enzyme required for sulfatase activity